jgi:hypothetical protein
MLAFCAQQKGMQSVGQRPESPNLQHSLKWQSDTACAWGAVVGSLGMSWLNGRFVHAMIPSKETFRGNSDELFDSNTSRRGAD